MAILSILELKQLADPALSIVIPAYNVERYVGASISSALGQTLREIEVIVVDDGSTDTTARIAGEFDDPRLIIKRKPNGGLSSARNCGIAAARGRYIGFLDGDDLWHPTKAERHLATMEADPAIGISYSYSAYVQEDGTPTDRVLFSRLFRPTLDQMIRRNHVGNGSAPVVRAECFKVAGTFDESLRSCEDWEMWVRLLRDTGAVAQLIPEVLTSYRIVPTSLTMNFAGFLRGAELAAGKIRAETPQVKSSSVRRGLATCYRIAGTKALHGGSRSEALRLIRRAVSIDPLLIAVDPRLAVTLLLAIVPSRAKPSLHRLIFSVIGMTMIRSRKKAKSV
jgi:glycosyltransferase involved in cell wall biosynthesis